MEQWFSSLDLFAQIYWSVAIIASVIFLGLLVMTAIGGAVDDIADVDAEIDQDSGIGFQFLSFKNLVGFFTIFGWSGISCIEAGLSNIATIIISIICGFIMMVIMASIFYYLGKLNSSGSLKMENALHKVGEVYLTIGANRSRIGKVQIKVQGTLRELDALTDETYDLVQGDVVIVDQVTGSGMLLVNKHKI